LFPRKNATPPVRKIKRPYVEHEHRIVTSSITPKERTR
jgi:hypothetical protein